MVLCVTQFRSICTKIVQKAQLQTLLSLLEAGVSHNMSQRNECFTGGQFQILLSPIPSKDREGVPFAVSIIDVSRDCALG